MPIDIQVWTMYRYDLPLRSDCDDIIHINTSISRPLIRMESCFRWYAISIIRHVQPHRLPMFFFRFNSIHPLFTTSAIKRIQTYKQDSSLQIAQLFASLGTRTVIHVKSFGGTTETSCIIFFHRRALNTQLRCRFFIALRRIPRHNNFTSQQFHVNHRVRSLTTSDYIFKRTNYGMSEHMFLLNIYVIKKIFLDNVIMTSTNVYQFNDAWRNDSNHFSLIGFSLWNKN